MSTRRGVKAMQQFRQLALGMVCVTGLAGAGASGAEGALRAGAAAVDISPPQLPVSINGGMSDRQATGILDPLHARCLVLDDGATTVALVVCDSCAIPRDIYDAAKELASRRTGIPASRMLMSATHTHEAVTVTAVFQSEPERAYIEFLKQRIAEAVVQAWERCVPAEIGWGVGLDGSQVFNRRWFTQPSVMNADPFGGFSDVVRMNPGFSKEVNREPSGPIDPQVGVLWVRALDGRPIAVWANYSLHYVGDVPATLLSADYYGVFAERMAARLNAQGSQPPFVGMMTNATSGNINNIDFSAGPRQPGAPLEQSTVVAASVASAAESAIAKMSVTGDVSLAAVEREIELGVRRPTEDEMARARELLAKAGPGPYGNLTEVYARETLSLAEYPPTVKVIVQGFRIGDAAIVSSPCETFVETGLAIKAESPFSPTFVVELANGYNGYLPTPQHHAWGGYETWRARSSYLAVEAEPKLRQTMLDILGELQANAPRSD